MTIRLRLLALVVALGLPVSLALPGKPSSAAEKFVMATFEFAPYVYTADDGSIRGLVVDIAREALAIMGREAVFQPLPWKRAMATAKSGRVDGILPIYKNAKRMDTFSFSEMPVHHFRIALFRKAGRPDAFDGTVESLHGKSIVRLGGSVTSPEFDKAATDGKITLVSVPNIESKFKMVQRGRVDFATGIWLSSLKKIDELGLGEDIRASNASVNSRPGFLAMKKSPENDRFLRQFDIVMEKMKRSGATRKIIAGYAP